MRTYDAPAVAAKLKMPMLIPQGGRDYQVTAKDLAGWKSGLAARTNVTFKDYPKLNHLFIEGEGASYPDEYEEEGHVHAGVRA